MSKAPATDWEQFFEAPDTGLIPRVQNAKDNENLGDICCTFVEKLYTRRNDARQRDRYRHQIALIFEGDQSNEEKLAEVIELLREMKQDRIVRAGKKRKPRSLEQALEEYDDSAAQLFSDLVLEEFQNVFDLLSDGVKPLPKRPLPYFLSKSFGQHLMEIVRTEFMPDLLTFNKREISAIENLDPKKREAAIKETFEEVRFRERFIDSWKWVWRGLTEQGELPEQPKPKKRDLVKSLMSQLMDDPEFNEEMTVEQWRDAVAKTEERNKKAKATWAKIVAPSEDYAAPDESDRNFIGNLIVHPYDETQKSIAQLAQMASQKASHKVFYKFQDGKDIDLALLLASMRYPKLFVVGKEAYLANVMRGFKQRDRRAVFPLVDKYLLQKVPE